MDPIVILQAGSFALDQLSKYSIEPEATSDFEYVLDALEQLEKPYLTPVLDPRLNDFTEANSQWILLRKRGVLIACIGLRCDNLGNGNVDGYWRRLLQRHYPALQGQTINEVSSDLGRNMQGRIAYIGDMFVVRKMRGKRDIVSALTALARIAALARWHPDWIYCMIRSRDARVGVTYGFSRRVPNGLTWSSEIEERQSNEVVLYANAEETMHELSSRVKFPENS